MLRRFAAEAWSAVECSGLVGSVGVCVGSCLRRNDEMGAQE